MNLSKRRIVQNYPGGETELATSKTNWPLGSFNSEVQDLPDERP